MSTKIYMVENDNDRGVVFDLILDGTGMNLSNSIVRCHMKNTRNGVATIVTNVVNDGDQSAFPGRCTTTFAASQLVVGTYTLEWQATNGVTIRTFPGSSDDMPLLVIRPEIA